MVAGVIKESDISRPTTLRGKSAQKRISQITNFTRTCCKTLNTRSFQTYKKMGNKLAQLTSEIRTEELQIYGSSVESTVETAQGVVFGRQINTQHGDVDTPT